MGGNCSWVGVTLDDWIKNLSLEGYLRGISTFLPSSLSIIELDSLPEHYYVVWPTICSWALCSPRHGRSSNSNQCYCCSITSLLCLPSSGQLLNFCYEMTQWHPWLWVQPMMDWSHHNFRGWLGLSTFPCGSCCFDGMLWQLCLQRPHFSFVFV